MIVKKIQINKDKTMLKNKTNISNSSELTLENIVNCEVLRIMTPAEARRLRVDIKKGIDIKNSSILQGIINRCPGLGVNLNNIVNDPFNSSTSASVNDPTHTHIPGSHIPTINLLKNGKKRRNVAISEVDNFQPITKRNRISEKRQLVNKKYLQTSNNREPKSDALKKINVPGLKCHIYDKDNNNTVEVLDSIDIDSDYHNDSDDSDDSDNSDNSDNLDDSDDCTSELNDDVIDTSGMTRHQNKNLQQKIKSLREQCTKTKITIDMVIQAKFNQNDEVWFYKNIQTRIPGLEGNERSLLEDKIEHRYKFLKSLQKANLYNDFSKDVERDITKEILESSHSYSTKSVLLNKLCNITRDSTEEYQKVLNWIDVVLSIPTEVKSTKRCVVDILNTLNNKLKSNLHGMDLTIREILQAVCGILTDPDKNGTIITLVGPPGVGKTTISSMISEAIGMGFGQVSCGSINDQAMITGHGSTYIGSKPGIITQYLIANKQLDNVILLDELDKLNDSKIIPVLLHVLDKTQNSRFRDTFCPEINIDLSKNLFIVAVNSIDNMDKALRDRLKIIHVNGYTVDAKTQICIKHIIPSLNKRTGIGLSIDKNIIRRCIVSVSPDISGVREIERMFGDIYEKILLIKHMGGGLFDLPMSVKKGSIKKIDTVLIKQLIGINI